MTDLLGCPRDRWSDPCCRLLVSRSSGTGRCKARSCPSVLARPHHTISTFPARHASETHPDHRPDSSLHVPSSHTTVPTGTPDPSITRLIPHDTPDSALMSPHHPVWCAPPPTIPTPLSIGETLDRPAHLIQLTPFLLAGEVRRRVSWELVVGWFDCGDRVEIEVPIP